MIADVQTKRPYDAKGHFVQRRCPDENCSGRLIYESDRWGGTWRCDGLTHDTPGGELRACTHAHFDGE